MKLREDASARLMPRLALAAVLLAGLAARVFRLGFQELRGDEAFGYFFSLQPPAEIVRRTLALQEPHPVGSYFVQHVWLGLAGHSEFSLRFVSAWFGALAVALAYRLAREAGLRRTAATAAAALLALSPYAIWHSQDARMYTISLALTLASTLLALRFPRRPGAGRGAAYVLTALAALHVHYFAAFVLLAQNVWMFGVGPRKRALLARWLLLQAALALLFLPWLTAAAATLRTYRGNADSPAALAALLRVGRVFLAGEMAPPVLQNAALAVGAALLVLALLSIAARPPSVRARLGLIALTVVVPVVATWLSARSRPIFNERYLIAAVPGLYILLAAGLERPRRAHLQLESLRRGLAAAGLVALLALGLSAARFYYFDPAYSKSRGWRELARTLDDFTRGLPPAKAWVVANSPDPTLWYYYPQQVERWTLPPAPHDAAEASRVAAELNLLGVQRVVVPVAKDPGWDGRGLAQTALAARYRLLTAVPVGGWQVTAMEAAPPQPRPVTAEFAGGLRLEEARWLPAAPEGDSLLGVHLRWSRAGDGIPPQAKITVQLLDPAGAVAAQSDLPLPEGAAWSDHALRVPSAPTPGSYRLIAAVYDPTAEGLPRLKTTSGADAVELALVPIR